MTVRTLIQMLQEFDPNAIVVLSSDAEGNRYRELAALNDAIMDRDGDMHLDPDAEGTLCVALYPV
jgi:hypothetical protein